MKASKRLIGAIVALVAALAVSVGSTFAWFTSRNTAKVNQFEVSVRDATGNLMIGLSEETVSSAPIKLTTEIQGKKLKDLTPDTTESSFTKLQTKEKGDANDEDYVKFTLYFEATTDVDVYLLGGESGSKIADGTNAKHTDVFLPSNVQSNVESGYGQSHNSGKLETKASNAARIAFGASYDTIWAPNETKGHGFYEGNLAADYASYLESGTWPVSKAAASTVVNKINTVALSSTTQATTETKICELTGSGSSYKGNVEIWIWIEGTDGDCLNSIFNDVLQIDLQFIGLTAPAAAG